MTRSTRAPRGRRRSGELGVGGVGSAHGDDGVPVEEHLDRRQRLRVERQRQPGGRVVRLGARGDGPIARVTCPGSARRLCRWWPRTAGPRSAGRFRCSEIGATPASATVPTCFAAASPRSLHPAPRRSAHRSEPGAPGIGQSNRRFAGWIGRAGQRPEMPEVPAGGVPRAVARGDLVTGHAPWPRPARARRRRPTRARSACPRCGTGARYGASVSTSSAVERRRGARRRARRRRS